MKQSLNADCKMALAKNASPYPKTCLRVSDKQIYSMSNILGGNYGTRRPAQNFGTSLCLAIN